MIIKFTVLYVNNTSFLVVKPKNGIGIYKNVHDVIDAKVTSVKIFSICVKSVKVFLKYSLTSFVIELIPSLWTSCTH